MSCSKPLSSFTFDVLYYLKRDQLERFSIVCRSLKNFIDRYFHSKPYRIFDYLYIRGGLYALHHNRVDWHPNREDYTAQQFHAGQKYQGPRNYYSFTEMRPYLGPTVRIKWTSIYEARNFIYRPEHVAEMESIAYLWRDGEILIEHANGNSFGAENIHLILNSPIILQCQQLLMTNAHFSFKEYKVLYAMKVIKISYDVANETDLIARYWQQFLEQPGDKPIVVFDFIRRKNVINLLDRIYKAFSSAVLPNAFKIVFVGESLTEFRETNKSSNNILELKKGLPVEYRNKPIEIDISYTLECSSI